MLILLTFAFLAGILTVLSPCVLPVLPALLSAGIAAKRNRSIGIILGLILSFTFFTLALNAIVQSTGLSANALRYTAIAIIGLFGLILIFPKLSDIFASITSPIANWGSKIQGTSSKNQGFWGGFILGIALGLVWTPCAGPILASVIALAATTTVTWQLVAITLMYAIGSALPMFLLMLGSSSALNSSRFLSRHTEGIRRVFGVIMVATAIALYFHAEVALQQLTLKYMPNGSIENNATVTKELQKLREDTSNAPTTPSTSASASSQTSQIPPFPGISEWINSEPLSSELLKGKVVLVDFWTYSCINCIRTFPYLKKWYADYKDKGLVIVGVHTPEFEFEKDAKNVQDATKRFDITYPVALDNNYKTWTAFHNLFWPAHYLYDQQGVLQEVHYGEGDYVKTENAIRKLLGLQALSEEKEPAPSKRAITPETYLGYDRAQNYITGMAVIPDQVFNYASSGVVGADKVGLRGDWKIGDQSITSESPTSELTLNFEATRVYLVMSSDKPALVKVLLDGKLISKDNYTDDMDAEGNIKVHEPRKYDIVNMHMKYGRHTVTLVVPAGVQAFAFTFGDEP